MEQETRAGQQQLGTFKCIVNMQLKGNVGETILSKTVTMIRDMKGSFKRGCLDLPVVLLLSGAYELKT